MKKLLFVFFIASLSPVFAFAEPLAIHEFRDGDKTIGFLYADFTSDGLMKSAKIKLNDKVLYTISCSGMSDENGIQVRATCKNFHGFVVTSITIDSISFEMADKNGHPYSDGGSVYWDKKNAKFTFPMF